MESKFQRPVFARKENPAGVYKIHFGPDWYYIGSSQKLKTRIITWVAKLKGGINKNKKIKQLYPEVPYIKFEILEITKLGEHKKKEGEYLRQHWDNPFLLNYSPDSESNFGVKHDRHGKFDSNRPRHKGKKIALFKADGELVKHFERISDMADALQCDESSIRKFLAGSASIVKGHKFKLIADDGSYVEPKPFISKKPPLKPKKPKGPMTESKIVYEKDKFGTVIQTYPSIKKAAVALGSDVKNFRRKVLNGRTGYYKGYFYFLA
jgi:hypothetical protein